jgi:hypothetical protein
MPRDFDWDADFRIIKIVVFFIIVLCIVTSIFFMEINRGSYSSIYIIPNTVVHNINDNSVFYTYGITSSEIKSTDYSLDTYVGGSLVKTKTFSLKNGETLEERVMTRLPAGTEYPVKITLNLSTSSNSESVHFWIRNTT